MAVRHISAAQRATLSGGDLRAVLGFVHRISAARDPDEFAEEVMCGLSELVPCDYVSYVETSPAAGRALAMTSPREAMFPEAPAALARNLHAHPLVRYYAETGELRALLMSDFLTNREFRGSRLYDELFKPAETDYLLSAVLPVPAGLVVGFSLHRKTSDFCERDRALVDLMQPHVAQAYERSLLRSAVDALHTTGRVGASLVVLGLDGAVLWSTPGADATLERHYGSPERGRTLPPSVTAWLDAGCPSALVSSRDGHRLRIESLGDRPAALLLTERPSTPSVDALRGLGLSRREAEVLSLVALGHPNSDIARLLYVSAGTVKRHLEHIYEKLGVHTRTAAAAKAWAVGDVPTPAGQAHPVAVRKL